MKAIVVREFGGAGVLKLEEVPAPKVEAGTVLVRVRAAGVNPVDAYMHSGTYARKPPLPYTPGQDGAGEVEAVGSGVNGFKAGDRVYISGTGNTVAGAGTYAERAICTPSQLHHLPARASFGQGAALGVPYCTAYRALFHRAGARPGETVLVHGASGRGDPLSRPHRALRHGGFLEQHGREISRLARARRLRPTGARRARRSG